MYSIIPDNVFIFILYDQHTRYNHVNNIIVSDLNKSLLYITNISIFIIIIYYFYLMQSENNVRGEIINWAIIYNLLVTDWEKKKNKKHQCIYEITHLTNSLQYIERFWIDAR